METRDFAKQLRRNMTDAERRLWYYLRAHRFVGQKFRRQQPLGPYIVDFVHFGLRLIVEADGGQHSDNASDRLRDRWLKDRGYRVLRFWNHDILQNTQSVLDSIWAVFAASDAVPHSPLSLPRGQRGATARTFWRLRA